MTTQIIEINPDFIVPNGKVSMQYDQITGHRDLFPLTFNGVPVNLRPVTTGTIVGIYKSAEPSRSGNAYTLTYNVPHSVPARQIVTSVSPSGQLTQEYIGIWDSNDPLRSRIDPDHIIFGYDPRRVGSNPLNPVELQEGDLAQIDYAEINLSGFR